MESYNASLTVVIPFILFVNSTDPVQMLEYSLTNFLFHKFIKVNNFVKAIKARFVENSRPLKQWP